jgi:hypothetical protein
LAQNWKKELRHAQVDPDNWEAINTHFLWTCHIIPQPKDAEDHPNTYWGDDFDKHLDSGPLFSEETDHLDTYDPHSQNDGTTSEPL